MRERFYKRCEWELEKIIRPLLVDIKEIVETEVSLGLGGLPAAKNTSVDGTIQDIKDRLAATTSEFSRWPGADSTSALKVPTQTPYEVLVEACVWKCQNGTLIQCFCPGKKAYGFLELVKHPPAQKDFDTVRKRLARSIRDELNVLNGHNPHNKDVYRPSTVVLCVRCGITGGTKPVARNDTSATKPVGALLKLIWDKRTPKNTPDPREYEEFSADGDAEKILKHLDAEFRPPRFMRQHVAGAIDQDTKRKGPCPTCRRVLGYIELEDHDEQPHQNPMPPGVCAECPVSFRCDAHEQDKVDIREGDALYRQIVQVVRARKRAQIATTLLSPTLGTKWRKLWRRWV